MFYSNFQWNNKKNDFSFSSRTVDEITQIIENVNSNKNKCIRKKKNVQKIQSNDKDKNKMEKKNRTKKDEEKIEFLKSGEDKEKDKNENKIKINESGINFKGNLNDKNDWKMQMEEMEKKYDKKFREYENRLRLYETELNDTNEYIEDISQVLTEKSLKIEELEFNLKLIGCRTAYKSFIDLFIYLFQLKDTKNLERNKDNIEAYLNKFKNEKTNKIISLIKDTYYLINDANNVAHFIDFKKNLITQILGDIANYTNHYEYLEIQQILENFKIENKFKSLVRLRTEKYKMPIETFKSKEDDIISKIRNNYSNKYGFNFLIK